MSLLLCRQSAFHQENPHASVRSPSFRNVQRPTPNVQRRTTENRDRTLSWLSVGRWTLNVEILPDVRPTASPRVVNILVIQLKRIGDLILTTPAIAALREKFPEARIDLVVSPAGAELTAAIPGIDRVFIAGRRLTDVATWLAIAFRRYDYCLDFTRTDRSALLTILSHARKRITYERANAPNQMAAARLR